METKSKGHLSLVTGETPAAPKRRGRTDALSLTREEARHLRAAIRGIARTRYGTIAAMGRALGVSPYILTRRKHPSAALAVAVWRLTGITLDKLLRGGVEVVPATLTTDAPPPRSPA
jgi:hypothetical protein